MRMDGQIDYVEFPGQNELRMRHFYGAAFGWKFADCGEDYVGYRGAGAQGVFSADPSRTPVEPMVVFYAQDLDAVRERVLKAGGEITREIFTVPGGRRFHFRDPGENEAAVWSDQLAQPATLAVRAPARPAAAALWRPWSWLPEALAA